jgi:hypothetical protein
MNTQVNRFRRRIAASVLAADVEDITDGKPFGEADARSLWLAALGTRREKGFGRVVPGVWSRGGNPR